MSSVKPDFEILVERADDYGALWARRKLGRIASERMPPREWPGTIAEARRVVDAFASQTALVDRERLAAIVQHSARGMWVDSVRAARARSREMRPTDPPTASTAPRSPAPPPDPHAWGTSPRSSNPM